MSSNPSLRELGLARSKEDRCIAAITILEQIVAEDPNDSWCWLNLGICYQTIGLYTRARICLENAKQNCSREHVWYVWSQCAILSKCQGGLAAAEFEFDKAQSFDEAKDIEWLYVLRASNLCNLERFAEAEVLLSLWLKTATEFEEPDEVYGTLGRALLGQGRYDEAREHFLKSKSICPSAAMELALKTLDGASEAEEIVRSHRSTERDKQ